MVTPQQQQSALTALWEAMKRLTPDALIALRELPTTLGRNDVRERPPEDELVSICTWAANQNIFSSSIVASAHDLRQYWRMNPHRAAELMIGGRTIILVGSYRPHTPAEKEWIAAYTRPGNDHCCLPDPSGESLRRWLERAEELYREREEIIYGSKRPRRPPTKNGNLPLHCEWFVRVQVLSAPISRREFGVDHAAVSRATNRVAKLLGVQRR